MLWNLQYLLVCKWPHSKSKHQITYQVDEVDMKHYINDSYLVYDPQSSHTDQLCLHQVVEDACHYQPYQYFKNI